MPPFPLAHYTPSYPSYQDIEFLNSRRDRAAEGSEFFSKYVFSDVSSLIARSLRSRFAMLKVAFTVESSVPYASNSETRKPLQA